MHFELDYALGIFNWGHIASPLCIHPIRYEKSFQGDLFSHTMAPAEASVDLFLVYSKIYEPRHEISNNVVCTTSKGSDQPALMRSLIRAFASRLNIL